MAQKSASRPSLIHRLVCCRTFTSGFVPWICLFDSFPFQAGHFVPPMYVWACSAMLWIRSRNPKAYVNVGPWIENQSRLECSMYSFTYRGLRALDLRKALYNAVRQFYVSSATIHTFDVSHPHSSSPHTERKLLGTEYRIDRRCAWYCSKLRMAIAVANV